MQQKEGYDARTIANLFLQWAEKEGLEKLDSFTPMKIIKLVYIAHGWCLAILGKPLITDAVEAWRYGPVIRSVYDAFKKFGNRPIKEYAQYDEFDELTGKSGTVEEHIESEDVGVLTSVYNVYSQWDAFQLANLTHEANSPWEQARENSLEVISNDIIRNAYKEIRGEHSSSD